MKHRTKDEEKSLFLPTSSWSSSSLLHSERTLERIIPGNGVRSPHRRKRTRVPARLALFPHFIVCTKVRAPLTRNLILRSYDPDVRELFSDETGKTLSTNTNAHQHTERSHKRHHLDLDLLLPVMNEG